MTTEIAIMNKSAVVLAADSAATIVSLGQEGRKQKTYNTANKLFSLSKYAPVGIMTFGNAEFMGIPWETIIKLFRQRFGTTVCHTIDEYCINFFDFLDDFEIEDIVERKYVQTVAYEVAREIIQEIQNQRGTVQNINETELFWEPEILDSIVVPLTAFYNEQANNGRFNKSERIEILQKFRTLLDEPINSAFDKKVDLLTSEQREQIKIGVIDIVCSDTKNQSGIVIAGFGECEYYPRCRVYEVGAILTKKTVYRLANSYAIDSTTSAAICPFAQSDEIRSFIDGISPRLWNVAHKSLEELIGKDGMLPTQLSALFAENFNFDQTQKDDISKKLNDLCGGCLDLVLRRLLADGSYYHSDPIINATKFLSKDELAQMAETLVNLESFRKKVALEPETVGGPIDIAIITKGDGLIWVKRKHYFEPSLNHHFFRNYFNNHYPKGESNEYV